MPRMTAYYGMQLERTCAAFGGHVLGVLRWRSVSIPLRTIERMFEELECWTLEKVLLDAPRTPGLSRGAELASVPADDRLPPRI